MKEIPPSDFLRGIPAGGPGGRTLRAGPVRVLFDPAAGSLRSIRCGRFEMIRGIYAAVRDRNWGTLPARISGLRIEDRPESFLVEFEAVCSRGEIDFAWRGKIEGRPDGTIDFGFDGIARSSFLRNRIGLCVLHPASCAGMECAVGHTDGSSEKGRFPGAIAPRQPFRGIRAISHEAAPGLGVVVLFEGEVFEMEDQRNWTDASFKTYSTPLELLFPVRVETGERVRQRVKVIFIGSPPAGGDAVGWEAVEIDLRGSSVPLPPIGLGAASHGRPLSSREAGLLRLLGLDHLRIDIYPGQEGWIAALERAAWDAAAIGTRLHAALFLTEDAGRELEAVGAEVRRLRAPVSLWLVYRSGAKATDPALARLAREKLGPFGAPFAAGTDCYFAELNRNRPEPDSPDLPCFSINPQVHAFDAASLVETLEAQPTAVETARTFSKLPVVVSPITLRPRFNPHATGSAEVAAGELPPEVDPRQLSLFCAGWTTGSIAALASTGRVHSLTYYVTTGWRGVLESEEGSPLPDRFPSVPGAPFPVYFAFAWAAGFERVLSAVSSDPLRVAALALEGGGGRTRLILANLTGEPAEVRLRMQGAGGRILILDEAATREASLEPLRFFARDGEPAEDRSGELEVRLPPCALARIDEICQGPRQPRAVPLGSRPGSGNGGRGAGPSRKR